MNEFVNTKGLTIENVESMVGVARAFAVQWHGDQKYGDYPYVYHLDQVARIVDVYVDEYISALASSMPDRVLTSADKRTIINTLRVVAYLHDVLEDTKTDYSTIEHIFGEGVADTVVNLTDEPGENRRLRKLNTWHKIRRTNASVYIKLCDRLANVQNGGKLDMYRKEFPVFQAALYIPNKFPRLWADIETATFK